MTEYAVRSRRVVLPDGVREAAIVIRGECISSIVPASSLPTGMHVEDAGDDVVMPGLVDCHVHINEPGRTEWEGFATATRAAAAGGVTTVVDMPLNSSPVTTTRSAFEQKLAATEGLLSVDTGFWGGVVPGNAAEILSLGRAGVLGSKCFLVHSGIDEFPNVTESDLREAMPRLRDAGIPLLVHAELDLGAPEPTDPRAYRGYLESRPKAWEDAAIALMLSLCRETGCPIHIVHLSSASAIPMLREARASGLPVTVETCPHYLCLEAEEVPDGATIYKCAPPIRERQNRDALWSALAEGVIDFVISDHSPCAPALKCFETGSFPDAWGGIASLQLVLPSIWTEARRRGFSIDRVAKWLSEAPARFAGLADRKGALEIGRHADIVVFDPEAEFEVDSSRLQFRHKMSPYLGRTLRGEVRTTYLRGKKVVEGSSFLAGRGRALLHRSDSR